jgi:hypothetical protein
VCCGWGVDMFLFSCGCCMGVYIIHYSIELIAFSAEYTLFNNCNFILIYRYSLSVNLTLSVTV